MADSDKAGKVYWDSLWSNEAVPAAVDPEAPGFRNYATRRFEQFFRDVLATRSTLLEVGCARSEWLPYFASRMAVTGLDYSEHGCAIEREALRRSGVAGEVVCADLFDPPVALVGRFDAVLSIGVVEHFSDTADCLAALGRYLAPGGVLITVVPNMTGLVGRIEQMLNPAVWSIHVRLSPHALAAAHHRAGLDVLSCDYFLATSFGVLNVNGLPNRRSTRLKQHVCNHLSRLSKLVWAVEARTRPLPATRAAAPYIVSVAKLR